MDDYDIELTPNDPEFGPDECESAYALWAFKEDGEPVKFLEASLVEDPDYPSGYSFSWRSLSCDRTGKLVEGEGGVIGDVSRADYVADMVLPGGAVFSQVEDEYLPNLPYSFEEGDLDDTARKSAAEAIRGAILPLPLSIAESTEAVPAFYRIDNPAMPDDPLTRDMLADALQSVENSHRSAAMDALLCNRHGMDVAKQALIASAARGMQSSGELFDMMSRAVGSIRATESSAAGVGDYALIFTEADLDEYAELIDLDCPDLDAKQRREVAATAVREWCRDLLRRCGVVPQPADLVRRPPDPADAAAGTRRPHGHLGSPRRGGHLRGGKRPVGEQFELGVRPMAICRGISHRSPLIVCSRISGVIPIESPKISALPVREALFFTGSRFERGRTIS